MANTVKKSQIEIRPVAPVKSELRRYVQFGIDLYAGNPCYVPPLVLDEINTLMPDKNPAFEYCRAQSFMAYCDGVPVGRITGIVNTLWNKKTGQKAVRFGWVDFIDDPDVSSALIKAVEVWGRRQGMTRIVGPLGFSDMDPEGMLIEGFDEMGTMATIYNYPYYKEHMERLGFAKEADWIEYRITVPERLPDKYMRVADIVRRRFGLETPRYTSRKKLKEDYGQAIFSLINEAFGKLYGYVPLTPRQIDYYVDMYLGLLRLDDVCVITDSN